MRILSVAALLFAVSQANITQSCTGYSPDPVPISQLPTYFPRQKSTSVATLSSVEEIRETLSLYTYIIDGRTYDSLSEVFTTDAVANYSAPLGVLDGVESIKTALSAALAQFVGTQHLLGSQNIRICNGTTALSATYFRAAHFLQQNATVGATGVTDDSAVLYAWAQYQDSWVKREGIWKIAYRNLVYMVSGAVMRCVLKLTSRRGRWSRT